MTKLSFTEAELMQDHDYAEPHVVNGVRMHGGMLADGTYQPPRAAVRVPAFDAWTAALRERGGDLFDAHASLLDGQRVPNADQQALLVRNDLGQSFWNSLTIIGKIEAKGRVLAEMEFSSMQDAVVEDISEMAVGHLHSGLLKAHGIDEGGDPTNGIGGHDVMWFVARDLAFGEGAFPDVEPPENIAREETGRLMPEVSPVTEGVLSFLMNLLVIEFRAENGFRDTQEILRTPDLFTDRRAEAELAAEMIERIRTDEEIHVSSLRLYLGEFAELTFKTTDGGTVPGRELLDRFWGGLVQWATVDQPALVAAEQRKLYTDRIMAHPDGDRILAEFDAAA